MKNEQKYKNQLDNLRSRLGVSNVIIGTLIVALMLLAGVSIRYFIFAGDVGNFLTVGSLEVTEYTKLNNLVTIDAKVTCVNHLEDTCVNRHGVTFNNTNLTGLTTCTMPLEDSCIPLDFNFNSITVNNALIHNLTATNFIFLNMMNLDEVYINTKVINVENSMTCNDTHVIEQSCFDISNKNCPFGDLDLDCIPDIPPDILFKNFLINSSMIQNNTITGDHIVFNTITGDHIVFNTINGSHIINNSIGGNHIINNSIGGNHIIDNSISNNHIINNTISSSKLACDIPLNIGCMPVINFFSGEHVFSPDSVNLNIIYLDGNLVLNDYQILGRTDQVNGGFLPGGDLNVQVSSPDSPTANYYVRFSMFSDHIVVPISLTFELRIVTMEPFSPWWTTRYLQTEYLSQYNHKVHEMHHKVFNVPHGHYIRIIIRSLTHILPTAWKAIGVKLKVDRVF